MSGVPDLQLGSDALLDFLRSGLQQLELDQGCEDQEARGLLQMLQDQTALMQAIPGQTPGGAPALTELEIAQQIDSLDAQLSQLEASLSSADASTMHLLGHSASKWLQNPEPSESSQQQLQSGLGDQQAAGAGAQAAAEARPAGDAGISTGSSNSSNQAEVPQATGTQLHDSCAGELSAAAEQPSSRDKMRDKGGALLLAAKQQDSVGQGTHTHGS